MLKSLSNSFIIASLVAVSSCQLGYVNTDHVKRIDEKQAESCEVKSKELKASSSHAFHHGDTVTRALASAKRKVAQKDGNAILVISQTFDFDHNSSKIIYQAYLCE